MFGEEQQKTDLWLNSQKTVAQHRPPKISNQIVEKIIYSHSFHETEIARSKISVENILFVVHC